MNDFDNEFIHTPTREDLSFLDPEQKLGLKQLTPEKAQLISSMTSSTHEVEIALGPHDEFVLVKTFAGKGAEALAQNELAILSSLSESSTVQFPTLHSPNVSRNRDGNPVLLVNFEPAYIPLSSMKEMLDEELKVNEPHDTITSLIEGIREMHELGIFHNDLHDNNIGLVRAKRDEVKNRIMIIDFDQSIKEDYVTPENCISDLHHIFLYMLDDVPKNERQTAMNKLLQIVSSVYGDMINIDALRTKLLGGN